ncbi:MAG: hypothetical protein HC843_01050 [Sphingomonadales bacterium]|nr:hypothetical protein [Sphingomonadales bacterium]
MEPLRKIDLKNGINTADICGELAVGSAETYSILDAAKTASNSVSGSSEQLDKISGTLEDEVSAVAGATDAAKRYAHDAQSKLENGQTVIRLSMESYSELIMLIKHLGQHITGFAAAMEQVKSVSQNIDRIARTTNMLALKCGN